MQVESSAVTRLKALLLSGFMLLLVACDTDESVTEESLRPVRFITVGDSGETRQSTFPGVSQSAQESRLSFKVAGTVIAIPVQVGDAIKADTVIARLDPSAYELQLQQAQANVAQLRAASRNARAAYERTRSLYANNNAALGDLDAARASAESAEAQLRAASKSLELAQLNLSYTKLSVDVDCIVDSISIEVNENVSTSTEVARVNCSDDLEIEVTVPESTVTNIAKGASAKVRFDAVPDRVFAAQVIEIGTGIVSGGSTFPVTVSLQEYDSTLRPGLAAAVSFSIARNASNNAEVLLPLSALVKKADATYVYVIEQSASAPDRGSVHLRKVATGELTAGGIEITDGLTEGEQVVTAGVTFLRDNLVVALR